MMGLFTDPTMILMMLAVTIAIVLTAKSLKRFNDAIAEKKAKKADAGSTSSASEGTSS